MLARLTAVAAVAALVILAPVMFEGLDTQQPDAVTDGRPPGQDSTGPAVADGENGGDDDLGDDEDGLGDDADGIEADDDDLGDDKDEHDDDDLNDDDDPDDDDEPGDDD